MAEEVDASPKLAESTDEVRKVASLQSDRGTASTADVSHHDSTRSLLRTESRSFTSSIMSMTNGFSVVPICGNCTEHISFGGLGIGRGFVHKRTCARCSHMIPRSDKRWLCRACDFTLCESCGPKHHCESWPKFLERGELLRALTILAEFVVHSLPEVRIVAARGFAGVAKASLSADDERLVQSVAIPKATSLLGDSDEAVIIEAAKALLVMEEKAGDELLQHQGTDVESILRWSRLSVEDMAVSKLAVILLGHHAEKSILSEVERASIVEVLCTMREHHQTLADRMLCVDKHQAILASIDQSLAKMNSFQN
eukprot:gnl/TRDRNA2_/TRDRNA2_126068_c0_seq1.p1 gnl/TRDRNA2_/TRDRNA2_126068_c0~~gnl/TRDRNA2_/TRDRNA2_126068_c0_seq1.p1  ORF type:complete len:312 (+),score=47.55 gnl/TRDRNA2_/TRDRNA2_126068_c0_seq1:45-980(+)